MRCSNFRSGSFYYFLLGFWQKSLHSLPGKPQEDLFQYCYFCYLSSETLVNLKGLPWISCNFSTLKRGERERTFPTGENFFTAVPFNSESLKYLHNSLSCNLYQWCADEDTLTPDKLPLWHSPKGTLGHSESVQTKDSLFSLSLQEESNDSMGQQWASPLGTDQTFT